MEKRREGNSWRQLALFPYKFRLPISILTISLRFFPLLHATVESAPHESRAKCGSLQNQTQLLLKGRWDAGGTSIREEWGAPQRRFTEREPIEWMAASNPSANHLQIYACALKRSLSPPLFIFIAYCEISCVPLSDNGLATTSMWAAEI